MDIVNTETRVQLIRVLAAYRIVPKKNPMAGTEESKSDYILERRGGKVGSNTHAVGTQTRKSIIKKLGIDSDTQCERIREKIKNHPQWGNEA